LQLRCKVHRAPGEQRDEQLTTYALAIDQRTTPTRAILFRADSSIAAVWGFISSP
jgi:hypothetical protein